MANSRAKSDEELWFWYKLTEEAYQTQKGITDTVEEKNLCYEEYMRMRSRIVYKKYNNPNLYEKLVILGKQYLAGSENIKIFAKKNNISSSHLSEVATHLRYLARIEKLKQKYANEPEPNFQPKPFRPKSLQFIRAPAAPRPPIQPEQPNIDIIGKQNDIELVIQAGIKVLISPQVDSMKIIKIIELLKDL